MFSIYNWFTSAWTFKALWYVPDVVLLGLIMVGFFYYLCFKDKKVVTLKYVRFLLLSVLSYIVLLLFVAWYVSTHQFSGFYINYGSVAVDFNTYLPTRLMVALPWALFLVLLYIDNVNTGRESLELPFLTALLFWFFIVGTMVFNFFMLFVIMEAITLSIVVIAGIVLAVTRTKSLKALLQFLVLNLSVSTFYLLGSAILLWLAHYNGAFTLSYNVVSHIFTNSALEFDMDKTILLLCVKMAVALIIVPIVFKLTLAPFSVWIATVYSELPVIVLFILMTVYKAVYIIIFIRLFVEAVNLIPELSSFWTDSMYLFVLPSMFVGVMAYRVQDIKSILALTTVSQMGYIMSGLIVQSSTAGTYSLIYLMTYCLQLFGLFALVILLQNKFDIVNLAQLFLVRRYSGLCYWSLFVIFLSLAGLPPFSGFFTKYFLFLSLYNSGNFVLAMAGLASSVMMAIIYLQMTLQLITSKESHRTFIFDQTAKNTLIVQRDNVYEYMTAVVKGFLIALFAYNVLFGLMLPSIYNIAFDLAQDLFFRVDIDWFDTANSVYKVIDPAQTVEWWLDTEVLTK